ncbi:MAG TPA: hypothetical protein VFH51_17450, partial [Myxococcota bacterium]|nr:hypothetical protein [Myxococcota bacterium]
VMMEVVRHTVALPQVREISHSYAIAVVAILGGGNPRPGPVSTEVLTTLLPSMTHAAPQFLRWLAGWAPGLTPAAVHHIAGASARSLERIEDLAQSLACLEKLRPLLREEDAEAVEQRAKRQLTRLVCKALVAVGASEIEALTEGIAAARRLLGTKFVERIVTRVREHRTPCVETWAFKSLSATERVALEACRPLRMFALSEAGAPEEAARHLQPLLGDDTPPLPVVDILLLAPRLDTAAARRAMRRSLPQLQLHLREARVDVLHIVRALAPALDAVALEAELEVEASAAGRILLFGSASPKAAAEVFGGRRAQLQADLAATRPQPPDVDFQTHRRFLGVHGEAASRLHS